MTNQGQEIKKFLRYAIFTPFVLKNQRPLYITSPGPILIDDVFISSASPICVANPCHVSITSTVPLSSDFVRGCEMNDGLSIEASYKKNALKVHIKEIHILRFNMLQRLFAYLRPPLTLNYLIQRIEVHISPEASYQWNVHLLAE
ncbi:uncharacterized protein EKO05_0003282 [Ascochyta rabiei]|uniref:uncharacterized protein n=1 Tax=Didymella rabiei TaxID=5454 RepID=UPI00220DABF2|nr:uncharacterized protein EKO05_0003282 [Ascochyta rabiei]UPX12744.1 hypothetical protein EKO05_0003282 [Ascochyta rabiei]